MLDFTGTWSRDSSLNENVAEGLIERGVPENEAKAKAEGPYIQKWSRKLASDATWNVKTYGDNGRIRRDLDYPIGHWKEPFWGTSLLFGNVEDGLDRTASILKDPDSDSNLSLVTITDLPNRGKEEARRYLKNGKFILKRTFWPNHDTSFVGIVSKEIFVREPDNN
jgi:hypothetical protein